MSELRILFLLSYIMTVFDLQFANDSSARLSIKLTDQSKKLSFDGFVLNGECKICHVTLLYTRRSHVVFKLAHARISFVLEFISF